MSTNKFPYQHTICIISWWHLPSQPLSKQSTFHQWRKRGSWIFKGQIPMKQPHNRFNWMRYHILLHFKITVCNPKYNDQIQSPMAVIRFEDNQQPDHLPLLSSIWREFFDHDHFLTCNESEERKDVRIQSFQKLLTQLHTPITRTSTLIKGLKTAYREHHQSNSQTPPTQQDIIGCTHFIRGRISKEVANTMTNFYQTLIQTKQRFTGIGWTKAVAKFMLETHVYEWKYRCELTFQPKSIIHDN